MKVSATEVFVLAGQNVSPHVVLELLLNKLFLIQKCTQANSKLRETGHKSTEMISSPLAISVLRECHFCIYFLTMGKGKLSKSWWQRMVVTNVYYALLFYMHVSPYYRDLEPQSFRCWPGLSYGSTSNTLLFCISYMPILVQIHTSWWL